MPGLTTATGVATAMEDEEVVHRAFAASRTDEWFVYDKSSHQKYHALLNGYCDGIGILSKPPCFMYGPRACGKSAVLATWAKQRRERDTSKENVFAHFTTACRDALQLPNLLSRLYGTIKQVYGHADSIPNSEDKLKWALPRFIQNAVRANPTVCLIIVIDAADELRGSNGENESVRWMPMSFPPQIRVIVSATTAMREEPVASAARGSFVGNLLTGGKRNRDGVAGAGGGGADSSDSGGGYSPPKPAGRFGHLLSSAMGGHASARSVASHRPGGAFDNTRTMSEFTRRDCVRLEVGHLDATGVGNVMETYLAKYPMRLPMSELEMIRYHAPSREPLYMRIVLDALRSSDAAARADGCTKDEVSDRRSARLRRLLNCETTEHLAEVALDERHADVQGPAPADGDVVGNGTDAPLDPRLFQYLLALLYVSRRGLSEEELRMLLGAWRIRWPEGERAECLEMLLHDLCWSADGLMHYSHEEYRRAVWSRCIGSPEQRTVLHGVIARFMMSQPPSKRVAIELPWNLERSGQWVRLKDTLVNLDLTAFWDSFSSRRLWQLYWRLLTVRPTGPINAGSKVPGAEKVTGTARTGRSGKGDRTGRGGRTARGGGGGDKGGATSRTQASQLSIATGASQIRNRRLQMAMDGANRAAMAGGGAAEEIRPTYDVVEEYISALDMWVATHEPSVPELVETITQIAMLLLDFGQAEVAQAEGDDDIPDVLRPDLIERSLQHLNLTQICDVLGSHPRPEPPDASLSTVVSPKAGILKRKKKKKNKRVESEPGKSKADLAFRASYYFRRWVWMQFPWLALLYKPGDSDPEVKARRRTSNAMAALGVMRSRQGSATDASGSPVGAGAGAGGSGIKRGAARALARAKSGANHSPLRFLDEHGRVKEPPSDEKRGRRMAAALKRSVGSVHDMKTGKGLVRVQTDLAVLGMDGEMTTVKEEDDGDAAPAGSLMAKHGLEVGTAPPAAGVDADRKEGRTRLDLGKAARFQDTIAELKEANVLLRRELDEARRARKLLTRALAETEQELEDIETNKDFGREKRKFDAFNERILKCEAQQELEYRAGVGLKRVLQVTEKHQHHCDNTHANLLELRIEEQRNQIQVLRATRDQAILDAKALADTIKATMETYRESSRLHRNVLLRLREEKRELEDENNAMRTKAEKRELKKRQAELEEKKTQAAGQVFLRLKHRTVADKKKLTVEEWEERIVAIRDKTGVADAQDFYNTWRKNHQRERQLHETLNAHKEVANSLKADLEAAQRELDELKFGQAAPGILTTELRAKEDEIHEANHRLKTDQDNYKFASNLVQQSNNGIRHLAELVGITAAQAQPVTLLLQELDRVLSELAHLLKTHPDVDPDLFPAQRTRRKSSGGADASSAMGSTGASVSPAGGRRSVAGAGGEDEEAVAAGKTPALNLGAMNSTGAGGAPRRGSFATTTTGTRAAPSENLHQMLSRSLLGQEPQSKIFVSPMRTTPSTGVRHHKKGRAKKAAAAITEEEDDYDDDFDEEDAKDARRAVKQERKAVAAQGAAGILPPHASKHKSIFGNSRAHAPTVAEMRGVVTGAPKDASVGTGAKGRGAMERQGSTRSAKTGGKGGSGKGGGRGGVASKGRKSAMRRQGSARDTLGPSEALAAMDSSSSESDSESSTSATSASEVDDESVPQGRGSGSGSSSSSEESSEDEMTWEAFDRSKYKKQASRKVVALQRAGSDRGDRDGPLASPTFGDSGRGEKVFRGKASFKSPGPAASPMKSGGKGSKRRINRGALT